MKIEKIIAREIYDSRGWPTIECQLFLENGDSVTSSIPSGLSTGMFESVELRDLDNRLFGKGVTKAIENIEHIIAPLLVGQEPRAVEMDIRMVEFDGTADKSRLSANAMLAVSMALYRAEALVEGLELYELIAYIMGLDTVSLPFPQLNIINGGAHANNNLRIQEFMIVPVASPSFRNALESAVLVYHELKEILIAQNKSATVGDEGGFAADFKDDTEALDILMQAINIASEKYSVSCVIALDVAASQFYNPTSKLYKWNDNYYDTEQILNYYEELIEKYPIYSLEDPLSQTDWQGWIEMAKIMENKVQIVGDDIFATNIYRISQGIQDHIANSVIIKPNQTGTITECLQAIKLCKNNKLNTIVSHRSGETCDTFISDLAVGTSAGQIKAGGCSRGERMAKYNRLLAIEDTLTLALLDS